jgi:hypothetical protein
MFASSNLGVPVAKELVAATLRRPRERGWSSALALLDLPV